MAWTLGLLVLYSWCMAGTSNLEQFSALAVFTFTSAQHSNIHIQIQQPHCNWIQLSNAKQFIMQQQHHHQPPASVNICFNQQSSCYLEHSTIGSTETAGSTSTRSCMRPPLLHILAPWHPSNFSLSLSLSPLTTPAHLEFLCSGCKKYCWFCVSKLRTRIIAVRMARTIGLWQSRWLTNTKHLFSVGDSSLLLWWTRQTARRLATTTKGGGGVWCGVDQFHLSLSRTTRSKKMSFVGGLKWWGFLTKQTREEFLFGVKIEPFSFHHTEHSPSPQQASSKQQARSTKAAKASLGVKTMVLGHD